MTSSAILTKQLKFSFGKSEVLKGIDLDVPKGSVYGFLGPNGSGKSTTIKSILGLLQVGNDKVFIFDKELYGNRIEILSKLGALIEEPSLYDHLTAIKNLEIITNYRRIDRNKINEVLDIVSLTNDSHKKIKAYSSGMKQRLGIAVALLSDPELLILDEPINGLDPQGIIEIRNLIGRLNKEFGMTIFISSHLLSEIERIATHIGIINQGQLVFQGSINELDSLKGVKIKVSIRTNQNEKVVDIVDNEFLPKIRNKWVDILVQNDADVAGLINLLVSHQIDIFELKHENNELEGMFLNVLSAKN